MSTTLCFAFDSALPQPTVGMVAQKAERYGYDAISGIDAAEADVQAGLRQASARLGWQSHILLKAPRGNKGVLAFGIQEEFTAHETKGTIPPFFDFLSDADVVLRTNYDVYWVVFAGEWGEDERIRIEEGNLKDLIRRLSGPGNWCQRLFVVKTGRFQDSDEVPLVFRVIH